VGLVVEPALPDGSLATQRMGAGQFRIETFGRSAHVGRAFAEGVSAVTALGRILVEIAGMSDPDRGRIVNVGPLKGGDVTNAVADYASCWGNVRFADEAAGDDLGRMLDALATTDDAMPRVVVRRTWNRPAKPLTDAVEALAQRARGAAEDLGQSLPFSATGGVCDGNILQHAGLPTIDTLGVRGGNLHRTDEFIELASLVERCQLLAVLIARLSRPT
jgi:glutamate carboxypeptidase